MLEGTAAQARALYKAGITNPEVLAETLAQLPGPLKPSREFWDKVWIHVYIQEDNMSSV